MIANVTEGWAVEAVSIQQLNSLGDLCGEGISFGQHCEYPLERFQYFDDKELVGRMRKRRR
jgi:hypothetical protein